MRQFSAAAAAAIGAAGCASHQVPLSKSDMDIAKVAILKQARNPDSTQFGEMTEGRVGGIATVCARVNSTNGFGGNTGFKIVAVTIYEDGREPWVLREGEDSAIQCALLGSGLPKDTVSADLLKKHHIGEKE